MAKEKEITTDAVEDTTEDSNIVGKVIEGFEAADEYVSSSYKKTWEDCWKLYNNIRTEDGAAYDGIASTFVPMTFSTIETMVSAIVGGKPKFGFVATTKDQEQDTKVLTAKLDYYWDCDKWSIKTINWVRNVLMYGTGIVYLWWDIDRPRMINVPLRDFFIDPTASTLEEAAYIGRRFLTTIDELESYQVVDPKTGKMMPMYTNLDKIDTSNESDEEGNTGDPTDKQEKDMWMGSTLANASDTQIECIEYWDRDEDKVYVVANREVEIRNADNPYKVKAKSNGDEYAKGLIPFVAQRDYVDEALFYGKGEIEPIIPEQELLNDMTNQTVDSVTYTLNQMYTLDPAYADYIEDVENLPGAVYPFPAGSLQPIAKGIVPAAAFSQISNIKQEIRETTAASEVAKGVDQSVSNVTATQIQAQQQSAGQRFGIKLTQFEEEGFHDLGKLVFRMMQLFVSNKEQVRIADENGITWADYDPKVFKGNYEPQVQLASTIKQVKQGEDQKADAIFQSMVSNPLIDQTELTKMYLTKRFDIDPDEVDKLLVKQQGMDTSMPGVPPGMESGGQLGAAGGMPPQGAPQGMPPMGAPQSPPPIELKSSDLVKLYDLTSGQPDLQAQIVQMLGLDPSIYPDLPFTQVIVKQDQDRFKQALDIQQKELDHERALAQNPQAPTPPGMMGVENPQEAMTPSPEEQLPTQAEVANGNQ